MSGRDSVWHRTCQAMYRKPVRTGESVPSTYVTFNVTKSRNHILWCVRRLKKDSKSPICAFYTDHSGQISVKVKADGPKIRLTYFTPDKKSTRPVTIFSGGRHSKICSNQSLIYGHSASAFLSPVLDSVSSCLCII